MNITAGFIPWWPQNPYQLLLKQELNKLGVRVIGNPPLNLLRILIKRDGLDIVHIHWPHDFYLKNPWRFPFAVIVLLLYRFLKNNIVWTVHELDFYETNTPLLDEWMRTLLMKVSRILFVHGHHTASEINKRYKFPRNIVTIRHPSYLNYYQNNITSSEARAHLGINTDTLVFLFFGYIKPYKGVEELIASFVALNAPNTLLIIAGKPLDSETKEHILQLSSSKNNIRTELRYIPDEEIQYFMRSANIVVFPFRKTQTSGSIMLALSYGKPVIAPAIATIPEYIDGEIGVLFEPENKDDLARALKVALNTDLDAMASAAARRASRFSWLDMANAQLSAYRRILKMQ